MPTKSKPRRVYGQEHRLGGGRRAWRSVLHFPTASYKSFRVAFKEEDADGMWDWTSRNAPTEDEGRALLAKVDAALLTMRPAPARARVQSERTMAALGELYLADNRRRKLAVRTVEGRESQLRAHIVPVVGALPVGKWPSNTRTSSWPRPVRRAVRCDCRTSARPCRRCGSWRGARAGSTAALIR
jgi:hypothetical protein